MVIRFWPGALPAAQCLRLKKEEQKAHESRNMVLLTCPIVQERHVRFQLLDHDTVIRARVCSEERR
jgi:hypothetical protein